MLSLELAAHLRIRKRNYKTLTVAVKKKSNSIPISTCAAICQLKTWIQMNLKEILIYLTRKTMQCNHENMLKSRRIKND